MTLSPSCTITQPPLVSASPYAVVSNLSNGVIVPLTWYPRLLSATMEQRSRWKVSGAGYGIHWPDIDEDLSTEGLLRGAPAAAEPARLSR
jgi:hypothetical protein